MTDDPGGHYVRTIRFLEASQGGVTERFRLHWKQDGAIEFAGSSWFGVRQTTYHRADPDDRVYARTLGLAGMAEPSAQRAMRW